MPSSERSCYKVTSSSEFEKPVLFSVLILIPGTFSCSFWVLKIMGGRGGGAMVGKHGYIVL